MKKICVKNKVKNNLGDFCAMLKEVFHNFRAVGKLAYAQPLIPRFNATKALEPCQLTHKSALWSNHVGSVLKETTIPYKRLLFSVVDM